MSDRYVLEGEWSGYRAKQRHIVHREVVTGPRVERLRNLHTIVYTDGTTLDLRLRKAEPREKVVEKHGYTTLIRDAEKVGKSRVLVTETL